MTVSLLEKEREEVMDALSTFNQVNNK